MCGRYTIFRLNQLLKNFPNVQFPHDMLAQFNVAPTNAVPAIPNIDPARLELFHWGLIPSWAKDPAIGNRMINARAETLAEKPAFRTALLRRRCLIPADGFYEWRKEGGRHKTPMYIHLKSDEPFAFAGLWDVWHSPDGSEVQSLTIITTEPNALLESIHNRMPAIVDPKDYSRWLSPGEMPAAEVIDILKPYPAGEMAAHPVSPRVNRPGYNAKDCIDPVESGLLFD